MWAKRAVGAFREAEAQGLGAISLGDTMIDIANAWQAEELIAWAEAIARKGNPRNIPGDAGRG